jgi:hypothetical protein
MAYDFRNLLLSFRSIKTGIYDAPTEPQIYETRYFYDEAGNRIRKLVKRYIGPPTPAPEYNENDDPYGYWSTVDDEFYVRDVSGKEMAIYNGSNLLQWNLWGLDNFGKIDANNQKFFYLKDHLGTIHAIVNQNNEVVYAQDGACPAVAGMHGAIRWKTETGCRHQLLTASISSPLKNEILKAIMIIFLPAAGLPGFDRQGC